MRCRGEPARRQGLGHFDADWSLTPPAPTDWALFHTAGLAAGDVVVWPVAVAPQSGPVLDDVALGVDEDANLAWAVELRADGSQFFADTSTADAMRELTRTGTRNFTYRPSTTLPPHWHPYERVRDTDEDAPEGSGDGLSGPYRQGIVADLTGPVPRPRPGPNLRMIGGPSGPGAGRGHTVDANALPSTGARLQRRTKLARAADGSPVLWVDFRCHSPAWAADVASAVRRRGPKHLPRGWPMADTTIDLRLVEGLALPYEIGAEQFLADDTLDPVLHRVLATADRRISRPHIESHVLPQSARVDR